MLVWNVYEFIECLEVIPEVEEYETSHSFRIKKHNLRLELTIFQYAGDVYLDLYQEGLKEPIFSMRLLDCPGARYIKTKYGTEWLEFAAAKSFGNRYDGESPIPMGVRLAVNPQIKIELF
jgi:hypothetical protein